MAVSTSILSIKDKHNNEFYDSECMQSKAHAVELRIDPLRYAVVNKLQVAVDKPTISALGKGLNFAITPKQLPYEIVICSIEEAIFQNNIPINDAEKIRHDVAAILCESKLPRSNITRKERKALIDIRNNKNIKVLKSDKQNVVVVMYTSEYNNQMKNLLNNEKLYKPVSYNNTAKTHHLQAVRKYQEVFTTDEFEKLDKPAPQQPPRLYGLPKICEDSVLLEPILCQIDSPIYDLAKHMVQALQPLVENSSRFVKDSRHFVEIIKDIKLEPNDIMVNLNVQSLYINISIIECLNIVDLNILPLSYMNLLEICLFGNYFLFQDKCYLQTDGLTMGNPVSPILANLWMEKFESKALRNGQNIIKVWKRNVDEIFCIFTGSKADVEQYITYLSSINKNIKFTYEMERDRTLAFLDVKVSVKADRTLSHSVYWKPTDIGRLLHATSQHHPRFLQSVITSLMDKAYDLCDSEHLEQEIDYIHEVIRKNGYQIKRRCERLKTREQPLVKRQPTYMPYIKGVTNKIGLILLKEYSIPTIYQPGIKIKQIINKPKDDSRLRKPGIYKINCSCGLSYIGQTKRPIIKRFKEHQADLKRKQINKSAIAEHVFLSGRGHSIEDHVKVLYTDRRNHSRNHSRIVREAIEIRKHYPYTLNRNDGFKLSAKWNQVIEKIIKKTRPPCKKSIIVMDTDSLEW
ncbi:uncharacterized protein LOC111348209 [Spodoptera litura]|uniref:Uncharacterized protein LOC111348209 n=1 Tax=Spodoptera litura TaxID=69820 RepID=A0A9J7DLR6_SPOLT|nr:uncharacterized protein LOC111348209 [Spodoptera litura]